jgi:class 3 adenylate cyclase
MLPASPTESPIRYAVNRGVSIAYQTVGDGPIDLVYTPGIFSNLDLMWEWPAWARFLRRLASFTRLILFDMRGVGLSDRGPEPPLLELQMDDVTTVMDAAGSQSAVLMGGARGSTVMMLCAASHPERAKALVLYSPLTRTLWAPDWPWGRHEEDDAAFGDRFKMEMGTGQNLDRQGPSGFRDPQFRRWWARFERLTNSPGDWREISDILTHIDMRHVLPLIKVPTLVIHRAGDQINSIDEGRATAERIPNARMVELRGDDHLAFLGDSDSIAAEVEEFLTGTRVTPEKDRILATVLMTDLAGSTEMAAGLGDVAWRDLLERHHDAVRHELAVYRGREIDTAGDGFMASFDGPARAIRCAQAISRAVTSLGLQVRVGVHTGEAEIVGEKLAGIAVHIAARVAASAEPGQVVVSSTVRDLVAGSGLHFTDLGERRLKGVPGEWRLYEVAA